ncbi:hypothetical protein AwMethylo_30260 [Methylobacterium sp.]|nr:hypothetical protein AwMethylo_30260 [Methylobacterium sp.]
MRGAECKPIQSPKARLACFDKALASETKIEKGPILGPSQIDIEKILGSSCNVKEIIQSISKAVKPKDQFESTKEFETRRTAQIKAAGIATSDVICEGTQPHLLSYNTDTKEVRMYIMGPKMQHETYDMGSYVGSNAYGASTNVKKQYEERWELKIPYMKSEAYASMSPEKAKNEFQSLRLAVVGDLVEPFSTEDNGTSSPTLTMPYEKSWRTNYLHYIPKLYVLYNADTKQMIWEGKIVACKEYSWDEKKDAQVW